MPLCLIWFSIDHIIIIHLIKKKIQSKETNSKDDGIVSVEEETQPTIGEHISFAIGQLTTLICKHSYIISNIVMMVSKEMGLSLS